MLFRKKVAVSEEQKAATALPRMKRVQYLPMKLSEAEALLSSDISELKKFEPVNYYASKNSYLQCTFYFNDDYSSVYFQLEQYDYDKLTAQGAFRAADYALLQAALRRFGQQI